MHALIALLCVLSAGSAYAQADARNEAESEPGQAKTAEDDSPPGSKPMLREGRPCDEEFMNSCPEGQGCVDSRCEPKKQRKVVVEEEEASVRGQRGFRLGLQNSFFFGFAGRFHNPAPAYNIALDFGFPTGRSARWHVEVGYLDLNGYTGLKFNPFLLGYAIPFLDEPVKLEVEVIAAFLQTEVLFGNGYAIALSAGMRAQLVISYGLGWAAFAPLGFEIRYAYGTEAIGIDTGAGANWPMMLIVGVEL